MDFVSAGKNTLLLYVIVCEKVVPRLNKHDDVMELNFMKNCPPLPEMKSWLRPCPEVMLHVELCGFAILGDLGLIGRNCMGCMPECALSTCLT